MAGIHAARIVCVYGLWIKMDRYGVYVDGYDMHNVNLFLSGPQLQFLTPSHTLPSLLQGTRCLIRA